jgi:hypothetical protein
MAIKPENGSPWALDFDDHRTSLVERILVYVGFACVIIGTVSEVVQAVEVLR